jgi:hypothetical protein
MTSYRYKDTSIGTLCAEVARAGERTRNNSSVAWAGLQTGSDCLSAANPRMVLGQNSHLLLFRRVHSSKRSDL